MKARLLLTSAVCGTLYAVLFESALAALWFTGGNAASFAIAAASGIAIAAIIRARGSVAISTFLSLAVSLTATMALGRLGVSERIFLAANPGLESKAMNELMSQGVMVLGFLVISLICYLCALALFTLKTEVNE